MAAPKTDDGLLLVLSECGPHVSEDEFNKWYDEEHAPVRLQIPGISSATRYRTTDEKPPTWLSVYDLATTDVLKSAAYRSLFPAASENEKSIISRLAVLNRQVYSRFLTVQNPGAVPGPFCLLVGIEVSPEGAADVDKWYEEEHFSLLAKVPGFVRGRRYKLESSAELAGKADPSLAGPAAPPYITVYDWATSTFTEEPTFKEALATPWTARIFEAYKIDIRLFKLHKAF